MHFFFFMNDVLYQLPELYRMKIMLTMFGKLYYILLLSTIQPFLLFHSALVNEKYKKKQSGCGGCWERLGKGRWAWPGTVYCPFNRSSPSSPPLPPLTHRFLYLLYLLQLFILIVYLLYSEEKIRLVLLWDGWHVCVSPLTSDLY